MTPTCPEHDLPVYGGPVQWHCDGEGGHGVWAADIERAREVVLAA